ncbi:selenocysteine-specific elongation factor [Paragonimus westermani]|uniref:Selenocysteine-specific elongation factor n=1 Tax=Paragonimus westermani TaxID=34504 RepID=A0A5J4P2P5_9TREM|nr:selenocysteine-specific elongation factor [Paragonimus westermani]
MGVLNINVGVLGHVDSGKTSLAKALSTVASTSAFDKNPQSKKRGITLDLGFSSFMVDHDIPSRITEKSYDRVQFTLVDCPGHGSLIRTVLCGSQIIDVMLLVLDATKGFQTQTAECLIIGEITCAQMIVVLNKCDLIKEESRGPYIEKLILILHQMKKRVAKTLEPTKFRNSPMTVVSAAPGGIQVEFDSDCRKGCNEDIKSLIRLLLDTVSDPTERRQEVRERDFLFAVDHCFTVTGQGTVLTGTVLSGTVRVGEGSLSADSWDLLPEETFRLATLVFLEKFGEYPISKDTALARLTFFGTTTKNAGEDGVNTTVFSLNSQTAYEYMEELSSSEKGRPDHLFWVLLEFERPFICPLGSLVIGAKLDSTSTTACRLAFHGKIQLQMSDPNYRQTLLPQLLVFRRKTRRGQIDRVLDPRTCVVRGLFKRETNWDIFVGLRAHICQNVYTDAQGDDEQAVQVILSSGRIESSFGQSGKCRLALDGYSVDGTREHGICFAVTDCINALMISESPSISPRILSMRLQLGQRKYAICASVYGPAMCHFDDTRDQFCDQLFATIRSAPLTPTRKLAETQRPDLESSDPTALVGGYLLYLCATHASAITSTRFQPDATDIMTWNHPQSNHHQLRLVT